MLDEIVQSTTDESILGKINNIKYFFVQGSEEQKMIDIGKKFGVEMSKENVYTIMTFIENFKDSLKLEDLKKLSVDQKYGLILEWENEKYLVLNTEYDFDLSKYEVDWGDSFPLEDLHQIGHYGYWDYFNNPDSEN